LIDAWENFLLSFKTSIRMHVGTQSPVVLAPGVFPLEGKEVQPCGWPLTST